MGVVVPTVALVASEADRSTQVITMTQPNQGIHQGCSTRGVTHTPQVSRCTQGSTFHTPGAGSSHTTDSSRTHQMFFCHRWYWSHLGYLLVSTAARAGAQLVWWLQTRLSHKAGGLTDNSTQGTGRRL